ncbi:hypothetical protein SELMODRAFT_410479 [Selaginella moellendorffii]|uniref:9-cis-epoxycarotenoid dioxygenase n=1 Tax=Selaginella moellendorffii TaxID=88036 RepID=D8REW0_SELML|nr:hypothetical protein SELMODRAFT_410479 [Selaginella moellendorffii]
MYEKIIEDHSHGYQFLSQVLSIPLDSQSPSKRRGVALCDTVENFISMYIDLREFPPQIQLADNFAPVGEFPPTPCRRVTGEIPRCLRGGAYIRNGSNPLHPPPAGYNYFDGHGMLHSVKFGDEEEQAPVYCARFTQNNRFVQEQAAGKPLFPYTLGTMSSYAGLARFGLFVMRSSGPDQYLGRDGNLQRWDGLLRMQNQTREH